MVLKNIQRKIEQQRRGNFLPPLYRSYCFSNIPASILYLFGGERETSLTEVFAHAGLKGGNAKKVILVLIDGFGYQQWLRYARGIAFLRRLVQYGVVTPLTTVFPSTTAAALTTIHSGLTPQEHGLPEWRVYFEEIDKTILTLPFTPPGEKGTDTLLAAGIAPSALFNQRKTIYAKLSSLGVPSYVFLRHSYACSAYSKVACRGSTTVPYVNASDLFVNVRKRLEASTRAYMYVYWDAIDAIAHKYGPGTEHYVAELDNFLYLLQKELLGKVEGRTAKETTLVITADHGHVHVNPQATIYLNHYRMVTRYLKVDRQGNKILPWGSPRDVFLAVEDTKVDVMIRYLSQKFLGKATVMRTEKALADGLFGHGTVHKRFKSRIGNILILPHRNATVWYAREEAVSEKQGMHGGLHPDEMLIPFAAVKMSSLRRVVGF